MCVCVYVQAVRKSLTFWCGIIIFLICDDKRVSSPSLTVMININVDIE